MIPILCSLSCLLVPILVSLLAEWRVKSAVDRYVKVPNASGQTGAEIARYLLDSQDLQHVELQRVDGTLTDHYDPQNNILRLSPAVYDGRSVFAAGVAAHEVGHAVQDQDGYIPLYLRTAIVPLVRLGSAISPWVIIAGFALSIFLIGIVIALIGVLLYATVALFSFVTLPVEFNASRRAKELLSSQGIATREEIQGVDRVLDAAALTYVAATIDATAGVFYYLLRLFVR
ncbi:MAG: zinc metallopeptidase [Chloroflexi bacterium]|nr:zinc metallopeptidase [Chloroflexota bacterium]